MAVTTTILIFFCVVFVFTLFVVFLSFSFASSRKETDSLDEKNEPTKKHNLHSPMETKFYRFILFSTALCIQGILLLPWVLNFEKTFSNQENALTFLFLVSVILIGHLFIWISGELEWE